MDKVIGVLLCLQSLSVEEAYSSLMLSHLFVVVMPECWKLHRKDFVLLVVLVIVRMDSVVRFVVAESFEMDLMVSLRFDYRKDSRSYSAAVMSRKDLGPRAVEKCQRDLMLLIAAVH